MYSNVVINVKLCSRKQQSKFEWSRVRFTSGAFQSTCSSEVERSIAECACFPRYGHIAFWSCLITSCTISNAMHCLKLLVVLFYGPTQKAKDRNIISTVPYVLWRFYGKSMESIVFVYTSNGHGHEYKYECYSDLIDARLQIGTLRTRGFNWCFVLFCTMKCHQIIFK